ncbi:MAG: hypothetical protein IJ617_09545, partial [Oscillospiraceae bacterium]|nr:hypothetical protein [Oscillospiraceae bacterium]
PEAGKRRITGGCFPAYSANHNIQWPRPPGAAIVCYTRGRKYLQKTFVASQSSRPQARIESNPFFAETAFSQKILLTK